MRTQMQTYTGGRIVGGQKAGFEFSKAECTNTQGIRTNKKQVKSQKTKYQQKSLNKVQKSMETIRCKNWCHTMGASRGNMEYDGVN